MDLNCLQLQQQIDVVVSHTAEVLTMSLTELHQIAENWVPDSQDPEKAATAKQIERVTKETIKVKISKRSQQRAIKKSERRASNCSKFSY